ncbi:UPF0262 family protein [Kiloniella sp. b19]|uniref:UPF0262 family protein n=1 Tax=Kiloniella sp. GXU_MW_B19 TaxID=3141326 RepID=UPI0031CDCDB3
MSEEKDETKPHGQDDIVIPPDRHHYLAHVVLDETTVGRRNPDIEKERAIATYDLLEENSFLPVGSDHGPYLLTLSLIERRLRFNVQREDGAPLCEHIFSLSPLRRVMREYFEVCDSYYEAIKTASPSMIEAIDMGRRGLHNDGADILKQRLQGKLEMDFDTARRLFTLICALHVRT